MHYNAFAAVPPIVELVDHISVESEIFFLACEYLVYPSAVLKYKDKK